MGTRDDFLAKLASWVGITETPPGSNLTPIGASFGWNGVAWCAETVSEALRQTGSPWLHEASVLMCRSRAQAGTNGMSWLAWDNRGIEAGMAVLFDWSGQRGSGPADGFHIGTVVDPGTQDTFRTIEGNYSDSVARVIRNRDFVQGFIRFPFPVPAPVPIPVPKPGDATVQRFAPALQVGTHATGWLAKLAGGGVIEVTPDGHTFAWGCKDVGMPAGKDYWGARTVYDVLPLGRNGITILGALNGKPDGVYNFPGPP